MPETVTKTNPDPEFVGEFLESILKKRGSTTYRDVTNHFGLPEFDGAWRNHPLCNIFEYLDKQDSQANRPFRTSAVISIANNRPGAGFFEALVRLRGIPAPRNDNERMEIWIEELHAAQAYQW